MEKVKKTTLELLLIGYLVLKTGGILLVPSNLSDRREEGQVPLNFSPYRSANVLVSNFPMNYGTTPQTVCEIKYPSKSTDDQPKPKKEKPSIYAVIRKDPVEELKFLKS